LLLWEGRQGVVEWFVPRVKRWTFDLPWLLDSIRMLLELNWIELWIGLNSFFVAYGAWRLEMIRMMMDSRTIDHRPSRINPNGPPRESRKID
jgi:hypothetical protein